MRVTPERASSAPVVQGTPRHNQGLTINQALGALKITPIAQKGFDLNILTQAHVAQPAMNALLSLQQAGVKQIHFFPASTALLEQVFSSADLIGLITNGNPQSRAIITQQLTDFLNTRKYQVKGDRSLLQGIWITQPVSAKLVEINKGLTRPTLRIAPGTTREEVESVFLSPELTGARFETNTMLIGFQTEEVKPAPEPVINGTIAAQLQQALEQARQQRPQTLAKELTSAFNKPLAGLLEEIERLAPQIEILESTDRKPAREALRMAMKTQAEAIIAQLGDEKGEQLRTLLELMGKLGIIRLAELFYDPAFQEEKLFLCITICRTARAFAISNEDKARFHFLEGAMNEEIGAENEALDSYRAAAQLDRKYRVQVRALENKDQLELIALLREFGFQWQSVFNAAGDKFANFTRFLAQRNESGEALRKEFCDDLFGTAKKLKPRLFLAQDATLSLITYLSDKTPNKKLSLLKSLVLHNQKEQISGYIVLYALREAFAESDSKFSLACDEKLLEILGGILKRFYNARRTFMAEALVFALAIEEDYIVFPDKMPQIQSRAEAGLSDSSSLEEYFAHIVCKQLYQRLAGKSLDQMHSALTRGDFDTATAELAALSDTLPAERVKERKCFAFCHQASQLLDDAKTRKQALALIKQAEGIDKDSPWVAWGYSIYHSTAKDHVLAADLAAKAFELSSSLDITYQAALAAQAGICFTALSSKDRGEAVSYLKKGLYYFTQADRLIPHKASYVAFAALCAFGIDDFNTALLFCQKLMDCFNDQGNKALRRLNLEQGLYFFNQMLDCFMEALGKEKYRAHWGKLAAKAQQMEAALIKQLPELSLGEEGQKLADYCRKLFVAGETERAEKLLKALLGKAEPESFIHNYASFTLAELYLSRDKIEPALAIAEELIKLKGAFGKNLFSAATDQDMGLQGAIFNLYGNICTAFMEKNPKEQASWKAKALEAFDQAERQGYPRAMALHQKGLVQKKAGDKRQALKLWAQAVQVYPEFLPAYIDTCSLLIEEDKPNQQVDHWETQLGTAITRMMNKNHPALADYSTIRYLLEYYRATERPIVIRIFKLLLEREESKPIVESVITKDGEPQTDLLALIS